MNKRDLERLSRPTTNVYLAIEDQLLINIAKKLKRDKSMLSKVEIGGELTNIQSWQSIQLEQLESLNQEQIKTISKYSDTTQEEVRKMLEDGGFKAVNEIEGDLKDGADRGILRKPDTSPRDSTQLLAILETYEKQALNALNLTNTTLLDQSKQQFVNVVNNTVGKVMSGSVSSQQALRDSVRELAEKGVPALIDKGGRQWTPEAYVNMVMRSTSNNVANAMQDSRMDEYGLDLVEISAHGGARPKCAPYQNRVFSRSGNHEKYPALSDTSIGEPDGLFGVNCGHVKYPFYDGISKKREFDMTESENNKIYEQSQQQRFLERQVRKERRNLRMMEELGEETGVKEAKQRLKDARENVKGFVSETGRTRRISREQVH